MKRREREPPSRGLRRELIVPHYPRLSLADVLANATVGVLGLAFCLPLVWIVLASIDRHASWRIRLPDPTLANYRQVLTSHGLQPFLNSFYLAAVTTCVSTVLAVLAAYPLSRRHVPSKQMMMLSVLFASGLPVTMMLVPIYQIYSQLGWLNSRLTTSLFLAAAALPFAIWLLKNYIDAIPVELDEAAQIEGAGTLRTLLSVIVPLGLPGLFVTAIYTFITAWGAFVVPLVLDATPEHQPGTVAIYQFLGAHGFIQFGPLAAFSLLFSVPVVVLYLLIARSFSGGFAFGGGVRG